MSETTLYRCPLCLRERKTKWYYEEHDFWVADCLSCGQPMIVYAHHVDYLSLEMREKALEIVKKLFGENARLRGYMRKITHHWHDHIILPK